MRTITITALMATLVAIPLIFRRMRIAPRTSPAGAEDDPRRYDLFDFLD